MRTAFILCLLGLATAASAASMRFLFAIVALIAATAAARGAEPPPVSYFDRVRAAFAKGAVLFDGAGRNYMVHASRREQADQGELHSGDVGIPSPTPRLRNTPRAVASNPNR